jgi:uncharacterized HAD superfamily protein
MNFVNYTQLVRDITNWLPRLPYDIDAVIPVPRSGIIPSTVIALARNIGVADYQGGCTGGFRFEKKEIRKALVLDDSALTGKAIVKARKLTSSLPFECIYGAVYVSQRARPHLDVFFKLLETPRLFEWNVFHHSILKSSCVDIDGVLCEDPTARQNDDGPRYEKFLYTARPLYVPRVKVAALVTNRLEKYRKQTEAWLRNYNVDYDKLIMHPAKSKQERIATASHASHKANAYSAGPYRLFIESSLKQATAIKQLTGKPVLSIESMNLV